MDRQRRSQSCVSLKGAEWKEWASSGLSKTRLSTSSSVKLEPCERLLNHKGALKWTIKLSVFILYINITQMGEDLRRNVASGDFCEMKVPMCHHTRMP